MKILESEKCPLDIFCEASDILNQAVEHTLGPNGTNTAVVNGKGQYDIINDGKSIIEQLTSLDPTVAPALETLKQASFETNRKAGDGTTSTTVIMNKLLHGAKKYLEDTNISPVELKNELDIIKGLLLKKLDSIKQDINEEDYKKVATVALGSEKYSDMLADVYQFLGKGKRPILVKSDIPNVEVEKVDGISLNKINIVSSLFMNTSEYNDIDIVCVSESLNRFNEITQLLRRIQQTGRTTLLFYNQMSTDILENLLFNYSNGGLKLIPIGLGGYGKLTYSIMEELSDYCGCTIVDGIQCKISEVSKIIFGNAMYATLNTDQIIIKSEKKSEKNYVHLEKNSVIMRLGGTNIVEREEVFRRIEDAVNSLGNAIDYGIVEGAGHTYSKLIQYLVDDEEICVPDFVTQAMNTIKDKINVELTKDIYDSAMVVKEVICNSFSIVSQVITTNRVIHENIR